MADRLDNYWKRRRYGRRDVLRGAAITTLGASAYALIGCGDDDDDSGTATAAGTAGASATTGSSATTAPANALPSGGKLTSLQTSDPTSLDPQFGQGGGDHQFFWTMHDNLIAYNQKGELDGSLSLAEKWELPDPTTVVMNLRKGVKFHDGTPFNGEAVKFNIERAQSETSAARAQMLPITKVEVVSETEIRLTLNKPNAAILTLLGDRGGAIVSPTAAEKFGKDLARNPVGTGKFIFSEWTQSSRIVVRRNPDYWGKDSNGTQLPYLDELRWDIVPDATVQVANMESGTADLILLASGNVAKFQKDDRFVVQQSATGTGWTGFYANQSRAPIDNMNLRRALALATDKAAFVQAVTFGLSVPALGPIAIGTWAYEPSLKGLDINPAEAKKALDASGYSGEEIEVVTINSAANEQIAELWKAMAAKVGINLRIVPVQVSELTNRSFAAKDTQINGTGFSLRADPDGTISETLRSDGFYNPGHRPNPELDKLIDQARETYDQKERKGFYDRIQQIAINEVYDWYLYYGYGYAAGAKKVLNMEQLYGGEAKPRWGNLAVKA